MFLFLNMEGMLYSSLLFVAGCVMGSFLQLCGERLPRMESILRPGSRCSFCGHPLAWYDLVPVGSWLALRGRCRYCGEGLSPELPLTELAGGCLFLLSGWRCGLLLPASGMAGSAGYGALGTALSCGILSLLLLISLIDRHHYVIFDELLLLLLPVAVLAAVWRHVGSGGMALLWTGPESGWQVAGWPGAVKEAAGFTGGGLQGILESVFSYGFLGQRLAGLILGAVATMMVIFASDGGMGWGDVKLAAVLGCWLGPADLAVCLGVSLLAGAGAGLVLVGLGLKGRKDPLPFAPFLSLGAVAAWFWGDGLRELYLALVLGGSL